MNKTILVSYAGAADPAFDRALVAAQAAQAASAHDAGIDEVVAWNRSRLAATPFYAENRAILDGARGGGYWLWKPYIILDALRRCGPDDVVIYWDVGRTKPNTFARPIAPLVRWCREHGGLLPGVPIVSQGRWTKRDCFHFMGCDEPRFWNARQVQATFSIWSGRAAIAFVEEWLTWCRDRRCLTDDANECGLPNLPGFKEHRHDQSILTNLCVRDAVELLPSLPVPPGAWSKNVNLWAEVHGEGDVPGSSPSLRSSLSHTPDGLRHARLLVRDGEMQKAELICRAILAREPWAAPALHLVATICLRTDRAREALESLRLLLELRPNDPALHAGRAQALATTGRLAEAVDAYDRALSLPNVASPAMLYARLADAAAALGEHRRAVIACRQALAIDPGCAAASQRLAQLQQHEQPTSTRRRQPADVRA
jgi:hypothetical protein